MQVDRLRTEKQMAQATALVIVAMVADADTWRDDSAMFDPVTSRATATFDARRRGFATEAHGHLRRGSDRSCAAARRKRVFGCPLAAQGNHNPRRQPC